MKTNPNDPATGYGYGNELHQKDVRGLTKRELFAAMAMQGILSDQTFVQPNQCESIVKYSVNLADALIVELNRTEK